MCKTLSMALILSIGIIQQINATPLSSIINNHFGYIGQPFHCAAGLMIMGGYRAYNAKIGAFLKQDKLSAFHSEGTFNGFDYAAGNPIIDIDPSGHDTESQLHTVFILFGHWVTVIFTTVVAGSLILALFYRYGCTACNYLRLGYSIYRRSALRMPPNDLNSM